MSLPLLALSHPLRVKPEPLTPSTFSPFGTVITPPLPAAQTTVPNSRCLPLPLYPSHQPEPVLVNQSTALKYSPLSPLINRYPDAPSHGEGRPLMSMFSCFPRKLNDDGDFEVTILERHPFTTQTFAPIGLSKLETDTCFLVIVAPSLPDPLSRATPPESEVQIQRPPDLFNLKAFWACGGQAVTYGVGTWHAPMVVLGRQRVDFVVTQFVSGVAEEDCQEVRIKKGITVHCGAAGRLGPKL